MGEKFLIVQICHVVHNFINTDTNLYRSIEIVNQMANLNYGKLLSYASYNNNKISKKLMVYLGIQNCLNIIIIFLLNRNIGEFPKFLGIAMETFLMLCDDTESDVRMVADECLNRTIKVFHLSDIDKYMEWKYVSIAKNPSCIRAAANRDIQKKIPMKP
jgi:hypothetical protein